MTNLAGLGTFKKILKCPKCKIKMVIGQAIRSNLEVNTRYLTGKPLINHETLELIDVLKCPTCGHSEQI